jgi:hypothetical protein
MFRIGLEFCLVLDVCLVPEIEFSRRRKSAAAFHIRKSDREKATRQQGSDREPSDSFESVRFDSRSPNPPQGSL